MLLSPTHSRLEYRVGQIDCCATLVANIESDRVCRCHRPRDGQARIVSGNRIAIEPVTKCGSRDSNPEVEWASIGERREIGCDRTFQYLTDELRTGAKH